MIFKKTSEWPLFGLCRNERDSGEEAIQFFFPQVLHVIDFDQLKIENQQYLEKIEERNNELLRLKLTTGNTVQVSEPTGCLS